METSHSEGKVRVRFAPSPTGYLHIGSLRTALFNWLYARHHGGQFLLRVEDTDLERSKPEYTDAIFRSLAWVGITADEEVVIQSERIDAHAVVIEQLLAQGKAYRCYCTVEQIAERHKAAGGDPNFVRHDGACRSGSDRSDDAPFVIRFKIPDDCTEVAFDDLIRGRVTFAAEQLDDFIIVRSDGRPTYNLVVVIDDAAMGITQVIRGEDHISNTPKQLLLYKACGYVLPQFAHLPMILGASGNRLSKRDAATGTDEYRTGGYLPDALLNYLVRLGWSHGDQEIFSPDELISLFSLENVGKKGAIFDPEKLDWLNGLYIRQESDDRLLTRIVQDVDSSMRERLQQWSDTQICAAIGLYKDRVKTLRELRDALCTLHDGPQQYADDDLAQMQRELVGVITTLTDRLAAVSLWDKDTLSAAVKAVAAEHELKMGRVAGPIRIALIGTREGPGLFGMLQLVGQQETVRRLSALQAAIVHEDVHE